MQIRITVSYHFTSIRMAAIKKKVHQTCPPPPKRASIGKDVEKLEFLCTVGENVNDTAAVKNSMAAPPKLNNRTTVRSSNSTSGFTPQKIEARSQRDIACLYS